MGVGKHEIKKEIQTQKYLQGKSGLALRILGAAHLADVDSYPSTTNRYNLKGTKME